MSANTRNFYFRNNKIRSKLLLFIDNEVQSKIKQNNQNIKFKLENESLIKICFEETFTQKKAKKRDFSILSTLKTKKTENSDKSVSTIDDTSNKITVKSPLKKWGITHSKTLSGEEIRQNNKILDNKICYNEKVYSIKTLSKHSSTFLILPKRKNAAEYLKNLCNNLKICKNGKKPIKKSESININRKSLNLGQNKKVTKKQNKNKNRKSIIENRYNCSLFKKQQKENIFINPKNQISRKSVYSVCVKFLKNE